MLLKGVSNFLKKEINKEYLNPNKVSSLKMLFFDCLSSKIRSRFNNSKILRRTQHYKLFKEGLADYRAEIDIV